MFTFNHLMVYKCTQLMELCAFSKLSKLAMTLQLAPVRVYCIGSY